MSRRRSTFSNFYHHATLKHPVQVSFALPLTFQHSLIPILRMRSAIFAAVAIARLAAAAPTPQQFDFAAVLDAPSPSATGPPLTVVANATSTFSVDTASIAASVSAEITTVATASITGASASAASTQEPSSTGLAKRGPPPPPKKTTSSSTATSSKTTTSQQSSTSTTSSTSACPTTPEAGTLSAETVLILVLTVD